MKQPHELGISMLKTKENQTKPTNQPTNQPSRDRIFNKISTFQQFRKISSTPATRWAYARTCSPEPVRLHPPWSSSPGGTKGDDGRCASMAQYMACSFFMHQPTIINQIKRRFIILSSYFFPAFKAKNSSEHSRIPWTTNTTVLGWWTADINTNFRTTTTITFLDFRIPSKPLHLGEDVIFTDILPLLKKRDGVRMSSQLR